MRYRRNEVITLDNENSYFSKPDDRGVRYYQSNNTDGVQVVKRKKSNSLLNSLIVFAGIIIAVIILGVSCNNMINSGEQEIRLPSSDYIAVVYVEGSISRSNFDSWGSPYGYQHSWTLNEIDRLIKDSNNRGMMLFVDSPGGGVYEIDELYYKVKEYQRVTGRPVYVSMASMAASGGYYISAPADKIYANRNCWTGSIGVTIGTLVDVSEFLSNYGIRTTTIASGRNKSMGNYFEALTQEQNDILQALVDEAYDQFITIIAYERGMDIEIVREISDGRIYTARQALELELIDAIGGFGDALDSMKRENNLLHCEVVDIRHRHRSLLSNLLGSVNLGNINVRGDAAAVLDLLEKQNRSPVSYLCEVLAHF